jgi:hypothetical protein
MRLLHASRLAVSAPTGASRCARPTVTRHAAPARLTALLALAGTACSPQTAPAPAQRPAPTPLAIRPHICDTLPTPGDSVTDTLYLSVEAPIVTSPLPPGYTDHVVDAIRQSFLVPHPLELPVFAAADLHALPGPPQAADNGELHAAVALEVGFTLGDTGSLVGRVSTSSLSPTLDQALADAPRRADSLHLLPPLYGPRNPGGPVRFYVTLLSSRPKTAAWAPLVLVRVPRWRSARSAEVVGGEDTSSSAPRAIGGVRTEHVIVQVVIDEAGHPVLSTFRLVEAHYREFARAAAQRLQQSSYHPASIGGCAVKGVAELRYNFPVAQQ